MRTAVYAEPSETRPGSSLVMAYIASALVVAVGAVWIIARGW